MQLSALYSTLYAVLTLDLLVCSYHRGLAIACVKKVSSLVARGDLDKDSVVLGGQSETKHGFKWHLYKINITKAFN